MPRLTTDWVDSSGVRLWYTAQLRRYDAGVMELGLEYTDKMAVPPGQESYTLTGYCLPQCTAVVRDYMYNLGKYAWMNRLPL